MKVRRTVDFTGFDIATATWDLGVDNAFILYANGTVVGSGDADGFTFRWEYGSDFGSALVDGENIIAVALDDYGGATAFDMRITAEEAAPAVPLPASLPLLAAGLGLAGLIGRGRRRAG